MKLKKSTPIILTTETIKDAECALSIKDTILSALIENFGPCDLCNGDTDYFKQLCFSIIGQQLSVKAANTIKNRVSLYVQEWTPQIIVSVDSSELRNAGLSNAKIKYIQNLSEHIIIGNLDFDSLLSLSSEEIIQALIKVPGIGRWTAEMFLIFSLKHSNVLSLGDAGLQRAVRRLYGEKRTLEQVGKKWTPYASVASWYLWRFIDATPADLK